MKDEDIERRLLEVFEIEGFLKIHPMTYLWKQGIFLKIIIVFVTSVTTFQIQTNTIYSYIYLLVLHDYFEFEL